MVNVTCNMRGGLEYGEGFGFACTGWMQETVRVKV